MKFSLPAAVMLFCATASLAMPQGPDSNDTSVQGNEGIDLSDIDITDVDYDPNDFEEDLATRDTIRCSNHGKIKRVKKNYHGKCRPSNSKGFLSAHNCRNRDGKSYLCVQGRKATCYKIRAAQRNDLEHGECFVGK